MNKILLFLAIGFATGMLSCSQQTLEKTDSVISNLYESSRRLWAKSRWCTGWTERSVVAYGRLNSVIEAP